MRRVIVVDSAAAVHTIRDRHSNADHRTRNRIDYRTTLSCFRIRLLKAYEGYPTQGNLGKVL